MYWNICFHSCSKMEGLEASTRKARDRHPGKCYITLWCSWRSCTNIHVVQKWRKAAFFHVRLVYMPMHHILDMSLSIRKNILVTHSCQWMTRGYNMYILWLWRRVNVERGSCPVPCLLGSAGLCSTFHVLICCSYLYRTLGRVSDRMRWCGSALIIRLLRILSILRKFFSIKLENCYI